MKVSLGFKAIIFGALASLSSVGARAADLVKSSFQDKVRSSIQDKMMGKILDNQKKGLITPEAAEELLLTRLDQLEESGRLRISAAERKRFEDELVLLVRDTLTGK